MSHTNSTTNFGLPQFITTDKPAWLTDVNVAYQAIDTAMKNNQTAAANAQGDATQALSDAAAAGSTASTANSTANGAIASLADTFSEASTYTAGDVVIYNNLLYVCTANVEIPGPWTGSTNWSRTTIETKINGIDADSIEYESGVSVKTAIDNRIAKTNVMKFSESKTSNYGVVTTNIPTTKCLLGAYFGSYGLIPYKHSSGNWYFNVVSAENGQIVPVVGETNTLVVYYFSFDMA